YLDLLSMDIDLTETLNLTPEIIRFFREVLIVLGIGLLGGLEREYSKKKNQKAENFELFAGVRTFPLVALIGYLSIYLGNMITVWIYPVALLAVAAFAVAAFSISRMERPTGATTEFALIAVFLLSNLVYLQEYLIAVFLSLLITALLALKVNIHQAVKALSQRDIYSIIVLAVITALILPLLPNKDLGIYGVFNPFRIWLIVTVFISLNFVAYFLHKFIDTRYSIIAIGVLGGFVSSTATAWYFSRLGGKTKKGGITHVAAIVLASSIMFPRILVWLIVLSPALLKILWLPVLLFGIGGFVIGFYYSKKSLGNEEFEEREISNPINFKDALAFGGLYVLIMLMVGFAEDYLGQLGVYFAAAISGFTQVDAITISMTNYAANNIDISVASVAILIAAFVNTFFKYALCLFFGNNNMRKY
ncbi:MAG: MgtC/SapB family protein, partial [Chitinophagales bacterium]